MKMTAFQFKFVAIKTGYLPCIILLCNIIRDTVLMLNHINILIFPSCESLSTHTCMSKRFSFMYTLFFFRVYIVFTCVCVNSLPLKRRKHSSEEEYASNNVLLRGNGGGLR